MSSDIYEGTRTALKARLHDIIYELSVLVGKVTRSQGIAANANRTKRVAKERQCILKTSYTSSIVVALQFT